MFLINARGLINSKRKKNDGCVYFGSSNLVVSSANDASSPQSGVFANVFQRKEVVNDVILGENIGRKD